MLGEHIESCGKEHVERLRKRGVVLKSVACKFNPEHVLPRMEINAHETWLCPDRNRGKFSNLSMKSKPKHLMCSSLSIKAPPPASSFRNLFPHLVVLNTSYDGIREAEAKKETLEAEDDVRQALAAEYRALDLPEPSFLTRDASALSRPSPKKTAPLSVTSSRLLSSTLPGDEDEEEDWGKTSTGVVFNSEGRNGPEFMLR